MEITQEMADAFNELREAEQVALVPAQLRAEGWVYRDVPGWFSHEMWELFLNTMGHDNYKIVIMSSHPERGKRGQFLLSPKAMKNLEAYRTAAKSE